MYLNLSRGKRAYHPALLIVLTLLTGGLFKLSAFAREAFIAAKFGLSSATDAYFGLQQLPLTVATFMFGSFALAFTPIYADERRRGGAGWLAGLTFYSVATGCVLTLAVLAVAPLLLSVLVPAGNQQAFITLGILGLCFPPVICIGIWAAICTAHGRNLWAMSVTGLPYLVMTLVLLGLYAGHGLNELGLPISMGAGFGVIGVCSVVGIVHEVDLAPAPDVSILRVWRDSKFRRFLRLLAASSTENVGFAANQLLLVSFLAHTGRGMISANNCAMRIGLLGYGLLSQPLAQLVQARLCAANGPERFDLFRRWLMTVAAGVLSLAAGLYACNSTVIRLVYLHGKFTAAEQQTVAQILPAWIGYFVIMSLNALVARYLFTCGMGSTYVRRMLWAYAIANVLRFAIAAAVAPSYLIWCSVVAEGGALAANLRRCFAGEKSPEVLRAWATAG